MGLKLIHFFILAVIFRYSRLAALFQHGVGGGAFRSSYKEASVCLQQICDHVNSHIILPVRTTSRSLLNEVVYEEKMALKRTKLNSVT
jgi:hypothetical protein